MINKVDLTKIQRKNLEEMIISLDKDYNEVLFNARYITILKRDSSNRNITFNRKSLSVLDICQDLIFNIALMKFNGLTDDCIWEELVDLYCTAVFKDAKHPVDFLYERYLKNKND